MLEEASQTHDEATRKFLKNMALAAERNSLYARAREWRNASPEHHAKVLEQVLALADEIVRSRGRPVEKPPLPTIKIRNSRLPELRL
jgi:hypothetical protein